MIALSIVGGLVLLVLLLLMLRVGALIEYGGKESLLFLRVGWFHFQLAPKEERKKEERFSTKKAEKKPGPSKKRTIGGSIQTLKTLFPLFLEGFGRLRRKLQVDLLHLEYVSGGEDPAKVAIGFGRASAVFGIFLPVLENTFHIKKRMLRTGLNYDQKESSIYLKLSLSLRVYQGISLALWFGKAYLKWKEEEEKKENPHLSKEGDSLAN